MFLILFKEKISDNLLEDLNIFLNKPDSYEKMNKFDVKEISFKNYK